MRSFKNPDESQNLLNESSANKLFSLEYKPDKEEQKVESKAKIALRGISEGKVVTIIMSIVTIYALIGDDIRLWALNKEVDTYFYAGLMVCFILFSIEIIVNTISSDEFKYSFFFWLDIIATLSLIPDIIWLSEAFNSLTGNDSAYDAVDATPGRIVSTSISAEQTSKVIRSLRLIRMIRIIKLYKYVYKSADSGDSTNENPNSQQEESLFKKETDTSKLGRILSDVITRRVIIIGVLLMLMVLPLLTYTQIDYSGHYGLRELFWYGRSNCDIEVNGFYCDPEQEWITEDGWNELLRLYTEHKKQDGSVKAHVLWLYIPDYTLQGEMNQIKSVPSINTTEDDGLFWEESDDCSGFIIDHDKCDLRVVEMELISYNPQNCTNGSIDGCDNLISYARLDLKNVSQEEASLQFYTTIFTCVIITVASIMFNNDTQKIVIRPITKMVEIIRKLAEDPLKKLDPPSQIEDVKEKNSHMKTKMLELTIYKISTLLQRGFGELGAQIIAENMQMSEEDEQIPGKKVYATFLMVKISQFTFITDLLQEEIIVFVNKIVRILHECAYTWEGAANKNYGDKYLITWILPKEYEFQISEMAFKLERKAQRVKDELLGEGDSENRGLFDDDVNNMLASANNANQFDKKSDGSDRSNKPKRKKKKKGKAKKEEEERKRKEEEERQRLLEEKRKREEDENKIIIDESIQDKADRTLMTAIKIISEIRRASDLSAYANHPKLGPKYNNKFCAQLTCGLHVGWLIEGAIGSEFKIDALYLSPGISVCSRIQQLCENKYGSSIMMSEEFKYCLSASAQLVRCNRPVIEENEEDFKEEMPRTIDITLQTLRMVDKVLIRSRGIPMELYSFDLRLPEKEIVVPEDHKLGSVFTLPRLHSEDFSYAKNDDAYQNNGLFYNDEDVYQLQSFRVNSDFYAEYHEALEAYLDGEWEFAIEAFDKCLLLDPEDGPAKQMKRFLQIENNAQVPEKWMGYRDVDYVVTLEDVSGPPYDGSDDSAQMQDEDEEASESEI